MRRVVKVGGSLLLRDDLLEVLPLWISRQYQAETLIVVGGGELIDAIRRLDRSGGLDPVKTHWLCVDLLDSTWEIFSHWFDWPRIDTPEALRLASERGFSVDFPTVVAVRAFYGPDQNLRPNRCVPLDWRTTTDTISALLANQIGADELVLLKSCDVDPSANIQQLASLGIVDEAMPMIESWVKSIRVEKLT